MPSAGVLGFGAVAALPSLCQRVLRDASGAGDADGAEARG